MSDDWDAPDETPEAPVQAAEPTVDVAKLQKALEKANKEALEARLALRRSELTTEYGKELVELIPENLPQTEWKDYAEKLQGFRGQPEVPAPASEAAAPEEEAVQEPPTPAEQQLATATGGPATGTPTPGSEMSAREIFELAKTNPTEADELIKRYGPSRKAESQLR